MAAFHSFVFSFSLYIFPVEYMKLLNYSLKNMTYFNLILEIYIFKTQHCFLIHLA